MSPRRNVESLRNGLSGPAASSCGGAAATRGARGRDNSSIEGMRVGPELTISQACAQGVPTYPHARAAEMLRAASATLCSVQFAIIQEDGVSAPLRKAGCARLTEMSKRPGVIPAQMCSFLEGRASKHGEIR